MKAIAGALLTAGLCFGVEHCFKEAEAIYGINKKVLIAIASVESSMNPYALNYNRNGSYDIGLMQINSSWFSRLGIKNPAVLWDPCYNIMIGAWILRQCADKYGESWKTIDCYNKGSKARNRSKYILKVYRVLTSVSRP